MNISEKIKYSKIFLYKQTPFFVSLLFDLKILDVKKSETAFGYTDAENIYINYKRCKNFSHRTISGIILHELFHILFKHFERIKDRNMRLWNIATDIAINNIIKLHYKEVLLPRNILYDLKYKNKNAEYIYNDLLKNGVPQKYAQLKMVDSHDEIQKNTKNIEKLKVKVNVLVGEFPDFIKKQIIFNKKTINWKKIVLDYIKGFTKLQYTNKSFNKKFLNYNFYLPSIQGNKNQQIVIAIDTSGSISSDELNNFLSIVYNYLKQTNSSIRLITIDSEIKTDIIINKKNKLKKIEIIGGGGTSFIPVFEKLKHSKTKCLFYFTDLEGRFPEKKPHFRTYWITNQKDITPPFGKIIKI